MFTILVGEQIEQVSKQKTEFILPPIDQMTHDDTRHDTKPKKGRRATSLGPTIVD